MSSARAANAAHPERSRWRVVLAASVVLLATGAFAACLAWRVGGANAVIDVSDTGQFAAALIASVTCLCMGVRQSALRAFWWLLAAACGAWAAGQLVWMGYEILGHARPPVPSWADVGYLALIPLAVAALFHHPGIHGSKTREALSLLDGLSIAAALLFLSWIFVLGPLWRTSDWTTLGGIVTLAYPFGDVVIAFFVVLALHRMTTADRVGMWFLLAGLIGLAFADSAYAYDVDLKDYATGNLLDTGWVAGFLCVALGAFASEGHHVHLRTESHLHTLPSRIAPLVPMLVALCVAAFTMTLAPRPDLVALTMLFVLVLLALVRLVLLGHESEEPRATRRARVHDAGAHEPTPHRPARAADHHARGADWVLPRSRRSVTDEGYAGTLTRGLAGERFSYAVVVLLICASAGISLYDLSLLLRFLGH